MTLSLQSTSYVAGLIVNAYNSKIYTLLQTKTVCMENLSRSNFFAHFGRGFVKEGATFVITDDLIVMPNSEFTGLSMLQNSGIKNTSSITEMTINLTKEKVINL